MYAYVDINFNQLVDSQPSGDTLHEYVPQNEVNIVLLTTESIRLNPITYISYNRGNKKSNKNSMKYIG